MAAMGVTKVPATVQIKQLSRAIRELGRARDNDVQIETLNMLLTESERYYPKSMHFEQRGAN